MARRGKPGRTMPAKPGVSLETKELSVFLQWTTQLTYLVFFTAILLVAVLIMNYFILLTVSPATAQMLPIPALVLAFTSFAIILMASVQVKRNRLLGRTLK